MLDLSRTRFEATVELQVHSQYPIPAEGVCLQHAMEEGIGKVRPSTGTSNNSKFLGFAFFQPVIPTESVAVEQLVVPAEEPYELRLQGAPTAAADMSASILGGDPLTFNASAGAGQFNVEDNVLTFNAAQAGKPVKIVYRRNLTAMDALGSFGETIGTTATALYETVTVIKAGEVYTDQFDTSENWAAGEELDLRAGANGRVQVGGTGAQIPGVVVQAPTVDSPFLGIRLI